MLNVDKNNIVAVTRGDTFSIPIFLNKGTAINPVRYVLGDNDTLYVGIMEPNQPFEQAIIKKKYTKDDLNTHEDIVLRLESSDTVCLIPGKYYYQVKLDMVDSEEKHNINTVIKKTEFFIVE